MKEFGEMEKWSGGLKSGAPALRYSNTPLK
jgi:hypothetical protein